MSARILAVVCLLCLWSIGAGAQIVRVSYQDAHSGEIDHPFRPKPITHSGRNRSLIPAETDHPFGAGRPRDLNHEVAVLSVSSRRRSVGLSHGFSFRVELWTCCSCRRGLNATKARRRSAEVGPALFEIR